VTNRETDIARECLRAGNKQKALLALRRKKYQESLLAKTDQQLAQLQALTSDVEFALIQKDVLLGLQQGTAVLKEIHKEIGGLDKVEMILSESAEAQAYQQVSTTSPKRPWPLLLLTPTAGDQRYACWEDVERG
jgi:charged multivesicular body protein 6